MPKLIVAALLTGMSGLVACTIESVVVSDGSASESRQAFLDSVDVFLHPRCLVCHSEGDAPRQGDDLRIHAQNVQRGPEGHGNIGMPCSACHYVENSEGLHMPPGARNWAIPTAAEPMIWHNKSPTEICQQLKDSRRNGGRDSPMQIVQHVDESPVVRWAWNPGMGRNPAPGSHQEFVQQLSIWATLGGWCPLPTNQQE